jgi:hypothetical protein
MDFQRDFLISVMFFTFTSLSTTLDGRFVLLLLSPNR